MARNIQPVELPPREVGLIKQIQRRHKHVTQRRISVGEVMRRALRFAGPKFLSGEIPLAEEVNLKTAKAEKTA